jgi:hypothetical protein
MPNLGDRWGWVFLWLVLKIGNDSSMECLIIKDLRHTAFFALMRCKFTAVTFVLQGFRCALLILELLYLEIYLT